MKYLIIYLLHFLTIKLSLFQLSFPTQHVHRKKRKIHLEGPSEKKENDTGLKHRTLSRESWKQAAHERTNSNNRDNEGWMKKKKG